MTIREAFAKSGYSVPSTFNLFVGMYDGDSKIGFLDLDPLTKEATLWTVQSCYGQPGWMYLSSDQCEIAYGIIIDNLPAIDALDALPECVRKVVQ